MARIRIPENVCRYGTTTCLVAAMQNNSGNILAVEPDHVVWAAAEVRVTCNSAIKYKVAGRLVVPCQEEVAPK